MTVANVLLMLKGAFLTLEIGFCAMAIGLAGGLILGTFSSRRLQFPPVAQCISVYVFVVRGTPLFVQVLIIYFGLSSVTGIDFSPFTAGVVALGANSVAYMAEIVRGGLNAIPTGQWEASFVLGYSRYQTLRCVILPQALKKMLPPLGNELVNLIKESSILMILGVPELTKVSKDIVARELKPMELYMMTAAIYLAMTTVLSMIVKKMEGKGAH